jgi:hypothetical protein
MRDIETKIVSFSAATIGQTGFRFVRIDFYDGTDSEIREILLGEGCVLPDVITVTVLEIFLVYHRNVAQLLVIDVHAITGGNHAQILFRGLDGFGGGGAGDKGEKQENRAHHKRKDATRHGSFFDCMIHDEPTLR